jgi:phosphoribosylanthranilate isomerase
VRNPSTERAPGGRLLWVIVQIYGITTPEDAAAVSALGPDHVGVVLDEGIETWDSVDVGTARAICSELDAGIRLVALSLSTDPDRIRRTIDELGPQIVHLARATDALSPEVIESLRKQLSPIEVMTTIPVRGRDALELAQRFAVYSDYLLLDTADPTTGVVGATGHTHDWILSAALVEAVNVPVVLAGGLGPDNVADAIQQVKPWGVDSETLTSRLDNRRRKDLDAVKHFIEIARAADSDQKTRP